MAIDATSYLSMSDLASAVEDVTNEMDNLESDIEELKEQISELEDMDVVNFDDIKDLEDDIASKANELEELREENREMIDFHKEMDGYVDSSETLIREDEFEGYARELAYDIGAVDRNADWPTSHIDWEAAADELKVDYTEYDYDGWTYFGRMS